MKLYLIKYEDWSKILALLCVLMIVPVRPICHLIKISATPLGNRIHDPILIHRSTLNTSSFSDQQLDFFSHLSKFSFHKIQTINYDTVMCVCAKQLFLYLHWSRNHMKKSDSVKQMPVQSVNQCWVVLPLTSRVSSVQRNNRAKTWLGA